jgi:hypothetical protein
MKYSIFILLSVFSMSCLAEKNNPADITKNFYESLITNNIKLARTIIVNPDNLPDDGSTSYDINKYIISKSSVKNNIATVKTSTFNNKGTISFNTVLENKNGKWKVDFNKTILNMARGAVKKKQVGGKMEINIEQK